MAQYWRALRETLVYAAAALPIAATINHSLCSVARIEGVSMQPALNPEYGSTDYVLVDKTSWRYAGGVERGDVVIITNPHDPSQLLVKRVIATEGDWIRNRLDQTLTRVPTSKIWVEGDNDLPGQSHDSNDFGAVPLGLVCGTAAAVVWPLSRSGAVPPADRESSLRRLYQRKKTRSKKRRSRNR